jgi:hypothetical protein
MSNYGKFKNLLNSWQNKNKQIEIVAIPKLRKVIFQLSLVEDTIPKDKKLLIEAKQTGGHMIVRKPKKEEERSMEDFLNKYDPLKSRYQDQY